MSSLWLEVCSFAFSSTFTSSFTEATRDCACDGICDGVWKSEGPGASFSLVKLDRLGATVGAWESAVVMLFGRWVWPTVRCDMRVATT